MFVFNLEVGLEAAKKEQKLGGKFLQTSFHVKAGPIKSTETRQG